MVLARVRVHEHWVTLVEAIRVGVGVLKNKKVNYSAKSRLQV